VHPDRATLPGEDALRFHHVLIRDAAYASLTKAERAGLHERFADWLSKRSPEADEVVGYHLEQAFLSRYELGDVDDELRTRAGERLVRAALAALDRADHPAALNLHTRALQLLPVGAQARRDAWAGRIGAVAILSGGAAARETVQYALEEAAATGDDMLELSVQVDRASFAIGSLWTADEWLRVGRAAVAAFERAGDDRALSRAWKCVGSAYHGLLLQEERAREANMRASECAERAGESGRAGRHSAAVCAAVGPMPVADAIEFTRHMLDPGPGASFVRAQRDQVLGILETLRGQFDEARALLADAGDTFERAGAVRHAVGHRWFQADLERLAGDLVAAEKLFRSAFDWGEQQSDPGLMSFNGPFLAGVLYDRGDYAGAERLVPIVEQATGADDIAGQVPLRSLRAKLLARRRSFAEAEALAREAVALSEPTDTLRYKGDALMDLAEVLALAGRADEAAATVLGARELYERKGATACVAVADRALAGLA
jgi:tetratricopeptide (TPR) repeat protein